MKKILLLLISLYFFWISFSYQELIDKLIDHHRVKIIKVIIDDQHKVVVSLSNNGESIENLMNKENWISAINGVYFCPKDYKNCWWQNKTNAPRFYKWENPSKYANDFWINGVFAFTKEGKPFIVMNHLWWYAPSRLKTKINDDKINDIYFWLWNFPVLILNWKNIVGDYEKLITKKMKAKWTKSFICFTEDRKTIYMWYIIGISIYDLANFIKNNFACYGAINLDAGASLWMIYNKNIVHENSRPVMDAFVVVNRSFEEKRNSIIKKYDSLLNRVVEKIKKYPRYKITKIIEKISQVKERYKYKFNIYVILSELEIRLKNI